MKPAGVLLGISGILITGSILLNSPHLAGVALFLLTYYSSIRLSLKGKGTVVMSFPQEARELERIRVPTTVEGRFKIPGIVRIRIKGRDVEGDEAEIRINPNAIASLLLSFRPLRKGIIEPEVEAVFTDLSGLFKMPLEIQGIKPLTVHPSPSKLAVAGKIRRNPNVFMELEKALGMGIETFEFEELREYIPGDELRRIDWKATSRFQKPIIKVFKKEVPAEIKILLNVDESFRRELSGKKIDYLTLILSQLIAYFSHHGHRLDIIAYNDKGVVKVIRNAGDPRKAILQLELKPLQGKPQLIPSVGRSRKALKAFLKRLGRIPLTGIEEAGRRVSNDSYVIVVDDIGLHPNELLGTVREMEKRGCRVVVLYPNPLYFLSLKDVNPEELETIFRGYIERKRLLKKMHSSLRIIELSPQDLLPKVVERL